MSKDDKLIILIICVLVFGMALYYLIGNNNANDAIVIKYNTLHSNYYDLKDEYTALKYEYTVLDKKYIDLLNDNSSTQSSKPYTSNYFIPFPEPKSSDECAMNKYEVNKMESIISIVVLSFVLIFFSSIVIIGFTIAILDAIIKYKRNIPIQNSTITNLAGKITIIENDIKDIKKVLDETD